jgi:leucyl/phenylalanyl-tRNA--protein transferase
VGAVPVEPPPSAWSFGDPSGFDELDDLVAIGADLAPGTLLAAYRRGLFPMPSGTRGDPMYWFCPVRRGVLPLDGLVVSRSLRRSTRDFEIRVDTAFEEVVDACADPGRDSGWIDAGVRAAYLRLHELGWAHSVEAWRDGRLAGGLYGVAIGGLFAGESMFHRERDASKVALVGLVAGLRDERADDRLIDVQWSTPHLASLGVVEISRAAYLRRLPAVLAVRTAPLFAGSGDAGKPPMGQGEVQTDRPEETTR